MKFDSTVFNRVFSKNMYKNHQISLGKMSFAKDFVNTDQGDLYPIVYKSIDCTETVRNGIWRFVAWLR